MGFNTTLLILNDALTEISGDKEFGAKVYLACREQWGSGKRVDIPSERLANAATLISQHHADMIKLIAVGGNTAQDLGTVGFSNATPEEMLKDWAKQLGYRVVKQRKKK